MGVNSHAVAFCKGRQWGSSTPISKRSIWRVLMRFLELDKNRFAIRMCFGIRKSVMNIDDLAYVKIFPASLRRMRGFFMPKKNLLKIRLPKLELVENWFAGTC